MPTAEDGLGWPDRGTTVPFAGNAGLGWPGRQPERLSPREDEVSRGALVNDQDASTIPGSERVRQALSAAVSHGTPGPGGAAGNIPPLVSANAEVVVPEVRANPADTPVGQAAAAAVCRLYRPRRGFIPWNRRLKGQADVAALVRPTH